jgi:hypothetical protein
MLAFTSDQWIIIALVFLLGLLVGAFLLAGSGRKWKTRYREESRRREEVEENHGRREKEWDEREKELRHRDSARGTTFTDRDGDGIRDDRTVRDRDGDGIRDDRDTHDDRKR